MSKNIAGCSWLEKTFDTEGDIGITEVTRAGWSQLLHISFLGFLFMGNTCSGPELWTHGLTKGLHIGKWNWPGKSNRTLPSLMLGLLMVRDSPNGGQVSLLGAGPSSQAVGLTSRPTSGPLVGGWHNPSALRKEKDFMGL